MSWSSWCDIPCGMYLGCCWALTPIGLKESQSPNSAKLFLCSSGCAGSSSRKLTRSVISEACERVVTKTVYLTYDAAVAKVQLPYSLDHDEPCSCFQNVEYADDCSVIGPHGSSKSANSPGSFYQYHPLLLILQCHRCRMASRFESWHVQPKEEIAYEKAATEVWPGHGVLCVLSVKWFHACLCI